MGFRENRRKRSWRKPTPNRNPLRKIVEHAYGDVDGSFPNVLFEVLECGHRQLPRSDFVGETNVERRRCRQCGKEQRS